MGKRHPDFTELTQARRDIGMVQARINKMTFTLCEDPDAIEKDDILERLEDMQKSLGNTVTALDAIRMDYR